MSFTTLTADAAGFTTLAGAARGTVTAVGAASQDSEQPIVRTFADR